MTTKYDKFIEHVTLLMDLRYAQELLMWDQATYMPPKGAQMRARSQGSLAGIYHEKLTVPELVDLVEELHQSGLEGDAAVNVREIRRQQQRALKIPRELVIELTDTEATAYESWVESRKKGDFQIFAPWLAKIIELQQRAAHLIGFSGSIYNAFLDSYEPGARVEELAPLFTSLRRQLVTIVERIGAQAKIVSQEIFAQDYPVVTQEAFNRKILQDMQFDLQGGRLDVTVHPFCMGLTSGDVRLTTRYTTDTWPESLLSTMHEAGHGLYEQGLPPEALNTPAGHAVSPAIHESQSRLWENIVGRSREFWQHYLPLLRQYFPQQLNGVELDRFYAALNRVAPSLIRTDSDEVTYNLHILVRFELERQMAEGEITVAQLPQAWNDRMENYLGVRPNDDLSGILQDVHWSNGLIGYFPTYTLGNLYSLQFFHQACQDIPDLRSRIAQGELAILQQWLRTNIHSRGRRLRAAELVQEVTGQPLCSEYFINYLQQKFGDLYAIQWSTPE